MIDISIGIIKANHSISLVLCLKIWGYLKKQPLILNPHIKLFF